MKLIHQARKIILKNILKYSLHTFKEKFKFQKEKGVYSPTPRFFSVNGSIESRQVGTWRTARCESSDEGKCHQGVWAVDDLAEP